MEPLTPAEELLEFSNQLREFSKDPVKWAAFIEIASKTIQLEIDKDVIRAIYGEPNEQC